MAIVHHANIIHWFEEARVDFMDQIGFGYDKLVGMGIDSPLLGIACEYHSMCRFGEYVQLEISIRTLSYVRMEIQYTVRDLNSGELRATGSSKHCFMRGGRPVSLKKAAPALYALFQQLADTAKV